MEVAVSPVNGPLLVFEVHHDLVNLHNHKEREKKERREFKERGRKKERKKRKEEERRGKRCNRESL